MFRCRGTGDENVRPPRPLVTSTMNIEPGLLWHWKRCMIDPILSASHICTSTFAECCTSSSLRARACPWIGGRPLSKNFNSGRAARRIRHRGCPVRRRIPDINYSALQKTPSALCVNREDIFSSLWFVQIQQRFDPDLFRCMQLRSRARIDRVVGAEDVAR
jgi:hypothetical protein